jgi:hypothetical protein
MQASGQGTVHPNEIGSGVCCSFGCGLRCVVAFSRRDFISLMENMTSKDVPCWD